MAVDPVTGIDPDDPANLFPASALPPASPPLPGEPPPPAVAVAPPPLPSSGAGDPFALGGAPAPPPPDRPLTAEEWNAQQGANFARIAPEAAAAPPAGGGQGAPTPIEVAQPLAEAKSFGPAIKTTRQVQTKEEKALAPKVAAAEAAEQAAAGKSANAKIALANETAAQAQAHADAINAANAAAAKRHQEEVAKYDAGQAALDQQRQQVIKDGAKGYWDDKGAAAQFASALMVGIGQFASALTGGPNAALGIINSAIERDAATKREKTRAELERLGIKGADLDRRLALADVEINNGKAAALEVAAAQREARLAKAGVAGAEADKDAVLAGLRKQALDQQLKTQQSLRTTIQTDTEPSIRAQAALAAGGGQGRAAGIQIQKAQLAEHGSAALEVVDRLAAKGVKLTPADLRKIQDNEAGMKRSEHASLPALMAGRAVGAYARSRYEGLSAEKQQLAQALDILAQKSAAIASPSHAADEIEHVRQMFSIMPGDSPKIMAQKLEQARGVIGAAKALGGKFTEQAQQGAQGEIRKAAAAAPPRLSPQDIARLNVALRTAGPEDAARIRQALAGAR